MLELPLDMDDLETKVGGACSGQRANWTLWHGGLNRGSAAMDLTFRTGVGGEGGGVTGDEASLRLGFSICKQETSE